MQNEVRATRGLSKEVRMGHGDLIDTREFEFILIAGKLNRVALSGTNKL